MEAVSGVGLMTCQYSTVESFAVSYIMSSASDPLSSLPVCQGQVLSLHTAQLGDTGSKA